MILKMADGSRYSIEWLRCGVQPKDSDWIRCQAHNFVTTWGAMSAIQQLAVQEGIDTTDDLPCICTPSASTT